MRNKYLERMSRVVKIKITGSNINNYLKRVIKKKIFIIHLIPISNKEVHVILKYSEYMKLLELKSIYEITVIEFLGSKRLEEQIRKNSILLFFILVGLVVIVLLSRVIFSVDIIHHDKNVRELLKSELQKYGIFKYSFKKSYEELESIEEKILEDNKDELEWIEISTYGTKYIVRIEERKINKNVDSSGYQSIISKKDAVLVKVEAIRGEKVKFVNEYVNKGDTIISGYIVRPDGVKIATRAEGVVYGEVWYEIEIDYPIVYQESNLTGKSKTVYAFYFFDSRIGMFDFDEYRSFEAKRKVLVNFNMLDIKFVKEKQYEVIVKDEVYTEEIAKVRAIDYIKDKLMRDNRDIVEISDVKILSSNSDEDSIKFKLFVKAIEDIGDVAVIDDTKDEVYIDD